MKNPALEARLVSVALFLIALLVRVVFVRLTNFDGLYGQDPFAYYDYSIRLRDSLLALQPPPPFFWPLGYPLLVAATMMLVGVRPLAGQLVSIIAGAFVAVAVHGLTREVTRSGQAARVPETARNPAFGCSSFGFCLLPALASQSLISNLSIMSDSLGLCCAAVSAWAMVKYLRALRPRWMIVAVVTLAYASLTRWIYALLIAPWSLAALTAWISARLSVRQIAAHAGLGLIIGTTVVGSQFVFDLGRADIAYIGDLTVVGWNPANAFLHTVTNSDGVFHYDYPIGLFYALPLIHPAFIFPAFTPFLLLGLHSLITDHRLPITDHRSLPLAVLLLGWPLTVYVFLAGIAWENPRFSLAFFPPLVVLVGLGIQYAHRTINNLGRRGRASSLVAATVIAGLLGSLLWSVRDVRAFTARKEADLATARWAETQLPPQATVITFGLTETLRHYTSLDIVELYNETPASLRELACAGTPVFLLVDETNIQSQWRGKAPQGNLTWLRENAGLKGLGLRGAYALFGVGDQCYSGG